MKNIAIIGSGAWGSALGLAAHRAGNAVTLWSIDDIAVHSINTKRQHPLLPDVAIPAGVTATTDLAHALMADILLLVPPAQAMREVLQKMQEIGLNTDTPLILCSKGIEQNSGKLMSELAQEAFPHNPLAVLSGPNFALEVAKGDPAAATLACANADLGNALIQTLGSKTFRLYSAEDIIGAQIGGVVKNVLAIACGMAAGVGYGENTRVMLATRGIAEATRLCRAKGGRRETLLGLCGIGDLMLTCGSRQSRNMNLGYQLGQGTPLADILTQGKTVEGYHSAASVRALTKELNIEMTICDAVYRILYENLPLEKAVNQLLERGFKAEAA